MSFKEDPDFLGLGKVAPIELVAAQAKTTEWLEELGVRPDFVQDSQKQVEDARRAFASLTTVAETKEQMQAVAAIKTPQAVEHLVTMLSAYDWAFVQQAQQLRGYVVAKLVEETTSPTATVRLRALEMLGKVTEVGLFTDKVEVKATPANTDDLDARIKEKIAGFLGPTAVQEITDVPDVGVRTNPTQVDDEGADAVSQ